MHRLTERRESKKREFLGDRVELQMTCECIHPFNPDSSYPSQRECIERYGMHFCLVVEYPLGVGIFVQTQVLGWEEHAKAHEKFAK